MTEDGLVSKWNVAAGVLWIVVGGLMSAAWVVFLLSDLWKVAGMLALTACATGGTAAVLHVRGYFARICRLIRVTSGLPDRESAMSGPRSLR